MSWSYLELMSSVLTYVELAAREIGVALLQVVNERVERWRHCVC